jgi:hypothetical protein
LEWSPEQVDTCDMNAILIGYEAQLQKFQLIHGGKPPPGTGRKPSADDLKSFARAENIKRQAGHLRPIRKR